MASLIAEYLTRKDIVACICVCREWEALFTPYLWSDMSLRTILPCHHDHPERPKPSFLFHSQSVRRLTIHRSSSRFSTREVISTLDECRKIEELILLAPDSLNDFRPREDTVHSLCHLWIFLITGNINLRRISIGHMFGLPLKRILWSASLLPDLEHFKLGCMAIDGIELHQLFLRPHADLKSGGKGPIAGPGVHSLQLEYTHFLGPDALVGNAEGFYPCLTRLNLTAVSGLDWNQQCTLIGRFSNLIYLYWLYTNADTHPARHADTDVVTKVLAQCLRIKSLVFLYAANIRGEGNANLVCRMSDKEHVPIIQALPVDLKVLSLALSTFGKFSFRALRARPFFATTLQELDMLDCPSFTGVMALDCLESCSGLVKFVAMAIAADELLKRTGNDDKSKPWACQKLTYLNAPFRNMFLYRTRPSLEAKKAEQERYRNVLRQHMIIFSKLAELTWLEHLWLGRPGRPLINEQDNSEVSLDESTEKVDTSKGELMLTLATGLGALASLRRLRSLGLIGLKQKMTMEDAQWMKENWRILEEIRGKMHPSLAQHRKLFEVATGATYVSL
ncbi:MAG: hypothetical protein BYD32DRAFT_412398 [Podila humilis]|nr:MAG: hypothetical protein BYD32DRAFT_412398 [Podila humilis]